MFERTEAQVLNTINTVDRNDNLLFTDVSEDTMALVINHLSQSEVKDNGYILVDFDLEEVKQVEKMILNTDEAFGNKNVESVKLKMSELQKSLDDLNSLIDNNPALSNSLEVAKRDLISKMKELEKSLTTATKDDELSRFLLLSAIAEEYVLGKILREIVKDPRLKSGYKINELEAKLEYFDEFLKKVGISSAKKEEYEEFLDKRFAIIVEGLCHLTPLSDKEEPYITCCFTNFQNVSNPLINRVINNFTAHNTRKFRTMIFTSASFMITSKCRDEGIVQDPYEYRGYTLNKSNQPRFKHPSDEE